MANFLIFQHFPASISYKHILIGGRNRKHMPENDRKRALDRESLVYRQPRAIRYLPPPRRSSQLLISRICTQRHSLALQLRALSQGFRLLYRHSRRRSGSPSVDPINAALKRFKLAAVTLGAASILSATSTSLFLCRCSGAFSSSFTYAAINLEPPSRTVLYQTPGSWHRSMSKRFIKHPYFISRATSIDSDCCCLHTASVFSNKADKSRSNQF